MKNSEHIADEEQIFNLKVSELKELIKVVLNEGLHNLPIKEKQDLLKKKLITLKEITQIFKVSKQTVYKWIKCNVLPPSIKVGGRVYFFRSEIEKVLTKSDLNNGK
jgi:excisionase family DNA binding protein